MLVLILTIGMLPLAVLAADQEKHLLERLDDIYFTLSEAERNDVKAAREKVDSLTYEEGEPYIFEKMWARVSNKLDAVRDGDGNVPAEYNLINQENFLDVGKILIGLYYPNGDHSAPIPAGVKETLEQLTDLAGQPRITGQVTRQSLEDYANALESAVKDTVIAGESFIELITKLGNKASLLDLLHDAQSAVLDDAELNAEAKKVQNLFNGLDITADDIKTDAQALVDYVDASKKASKALLLGYIRTQGSLEYVEGDGAYVYKIDGIGSAIPNNLFTWTLYDATIASLELTDYGLVISPTANSTGGTVTIEAHLTDNAYSSNPLFGGMFFKGEVEVEAAPSGGGDPRPPTTGGGPIAPTLTPPVEVEQIIGQVSETLKAIDPERAEQATQAVKDAIREASTIDAASRVANEAGRATLNLQLNALTSLQFETIKDNAERLNKLLNDTVVGAVPAPVVVTFDLGTTEESGARLTINEDVVNEARANNIDAIAIKVNGVSITIYVSDLDGDTVLDIDFAAESVATDVTALPLASGVFTFSILTNGEVKSSFNRPLEISIPIENAAGLDTELLVLAKIVNGQLVFYGGSYDEATGMFNVTRNSLSSYVVVENKVSFNDTSSYTWAQREIDVVAAKGVIEGRGGGVFDPAATLTRAEYATMLVRAFGLEDANATDSFTDVNDGDWFQPYVAAAVKEGLILGRGNNIFDPHAKVTRAEMATMAARAMKSVRGVRDVNDVNAQLEQFIDTANIALSMQADIALSISRGIIVGVGDHAFDPNGHSTRAQAAVVIYRLLNQ